MTVAWADVANTVVDIVGRSGFGIGSAGLPAYNVLIEGLNEALDYDVVLSMKQAVQAAPSRVVDDARGRRLVPAPRPPDRRVAAGRCRPTPTACSGGPSCAGSATSSPSSRPTRTTSTGTTSPSPASCATCCTTSAGRPPARTASPTPTPTRRWSSCQVEDAILAVVGRPGGRVRRRPRRLRRGLRRGRAGRPPPLRRGLPRRPRPGRRPAPRTSPAAGRGWHHRGRGRLNYDELNSTVRYAMWSVFRTDPAGCPTTARPLGEELADHLDAAGGQGRRRARGLRPRGHACRRRLDGLDPRAGHRVAAGHLLRAAAHGAGPRVDARCGRPRRCTGPRSSTRATCPRSSRGRSPRATSASTRSSAPSTGTCSPTRSGARCSPTTARPPAATPTCAPTPCRRSRSATTSGSSPSRPTSSTGSSTSCATCAPPRPAATSARRSRSSPGRGSRRSSSPPALP